MAKTTNKRMTATIEGDFVVFLIGMRINQPWKIHKWFSVGQEMPKMLRELSQHPEMGLLGFNTYFSFPNVMVVQYWRSFEHLNAYAGNHNAQHFPAWVRFNKRIATDGSVGIWHETYRVAAGAYENVYTNMPAYGLGQAGTLMPAVGRRSTAAKRIQASKHEQGEESNGATTNPPDAITADLYAPK